MARYDAVIFDLFGTLIHTVPPDDYGAMLGEVAGALGIHSDTFTKAWRTTIDERESGLFGGIDEILAKTAAAAGRAASSGEVIDAKQRWLAITAGWLAPREEARATLAAIRATGAKVGLLSNCSAEIPPLWPAAGLADLFDHVVFSCNVGVMKPHPSVYEAASGPLGVKSERCMFVGDGGARELTGASAVGMEAVLLRVPGEEHTWFDSFYRKDALEWPGTIVASLSELTSLI
jgi:putative hydrolase of the HAD superfamily